MPAEAYPWIHLAALWAETANERRFLPMHSSRRGALPCQCGFRKQRKTSFTWSAGHYNTVSRINAQNCATALLQNIVVPRLCLHGIEMRVERNMYVCHGKCVLDKIAVEQRAVPKKVFFMLRDCFSMFSSCFDRRSSCGRAMSNPPKTCFTKSLQLPKRNWSFHHHLRF